MSRHDIIIIDLKFHLVWITAYGKAILTIEVAAMLDELVLRICESRDFEILKRHIFREYICIFLLLPPNISLNSLLNSMEYKKSRKLMMGFKALGQQLGGVIRGHVAVLLPIQVLSLMGYHGINRAAGLYPCKGCF